jgi:hypothetical protein
VISTFRVLNASPKCRFLAREAGLREIVGYIIFFTVGLVCAGTYFYQLHPEHTPDADLPRLRKDVDDAVDRGRRIRDAWDRPNSDESKAETGAGKPVR